VNGIRNSEFGIRNYLTHNPLPPIPPYTTPLPPYSPSPLIKGDEGGCPKGARGLSPLIKGGRGVVRGIKGERGLGGCIKGTAAAFLPIFCKLSTARET
jgi:hypothetical protein